MADRIVRRRLLCLVPPAILAFSVAGVLIFFVCEASVGGLHRPKTQLHTGPTQQVVASPEARVRAMDFYRASRTSFEVNVGQEDSEVKFSARGNDYRIFLTEEGARFTLGYGAKAATSSFAMKFRGANIAPHVSGLEKLSRTTNYFVGRDPSKWRTNASNYAKVEYAAIYPGIDLVYYGKDHELEYDLIVQPTARPSDIGIVFSGSGCTPKIHLDLHGDLTVRTLDGEVRMHRPVVYQRGRNNEEVRIRAHYVISQGAERSIKKNQEVAVRVGDYDRSKPLIVDPVVTFSTFLGGTQSDTAKAVAVDSTGNVYVVGGTFSTDFPTSNPIQATMHGTNGDAFVTKINAAGTAILYSTYLGGNFTQQANGVAVDSAGNAYVVGQTASNDFPITQGAFDTSCDSCGASAGGVAFISKLDSTGSRLLYSTYLGGTGGSATGDRGDAIAVDASGFAYVTGGSYSPDFPTTPGAFQRARIGDLEQVFVTVLDTGGSALNYSTYLGGGEGFGIAVNASGNAYVAGATGTATFPTTPGAFQTVIGSAAGSGNDAFITELNTSGSGLVYSTFLGGAEEDYAGGVAIDGAGNAYAAGQTFSTNFPVKNAFQQNLKGTANAYVAKLSPNGSALAYPTYLGGSKDDSGVTIAVDSGGNAYITGFAASTDFPLVGALQSTYGGGSMDAFLTVMDPNGTPVFSTFIGGSSDDQGNGIAVDSAGNVYLAGATQSGGFPTVNPIQPRLATGGECTPSPCADAFVTKFSVSTVTPAPDFALTLSPQSASIAAGQPTTFSVGLTSIGGFNQSVSLGCSVQPAGPSCSISPSSLTSTGLSSPAAAVGLSTIATASSSPITTYSDNQAAVQTDLLRTFFAGSCAALLLVGFKRSVAHFRVPASWIGLWTILFVVILLQACGSGGGGNGGGGTKPGTYTVTVTGPSGSLGHNEPFTLIVD